VNDGTYDEGVERMASPSSRWPTRESSRFQILRGLRASNHVTGLIGMAMVLSVIAVSLLAPFITSYHPDVTQLANAYLPTSATHWFGTDDLGRDIFTRVMYGGRYSLSVGVSSVAIGGVIGTALGILSGYYRPLDGLIMRVMDILLAFPGIILALVIVASLGAGERNVIVATAIFSIPGFARLVRSSTLAVKQELYIESARIIGCSNLRIMLRCILPNILTPIIVQSTLRVGISILISAGLSFLGLGAQPPSPDWGAMVSEGQVSIYNAPWISLFPGLAIFWIVVGINLFGDWLRDKLDSKAKAV